MAGPCARPGGFQGGVKMVAMFWTICFVGLIGIIELFRVTWNYFKGSSFTRVGRASEDFKKWQREREGKQ